MTNSGWTPLHLLLYNITPSIVILLHWCVERIYQWWIWIGLIFAQNQGVVLPRSALVCSPDQACPGSGPQFITLEDWTTIQILRTLQPSSIDDLILPAPKLKFIFIRLKDLSLICTVFNLQPTAGQSIEIFGPKSFPFNMILGVQRWKGAAASWERQVKATLGWIKFPWWLLTLH